MDHEFWESRWTTGQIGFHEGKVNEFLAANVQRLAGRRRVLVPLCGKAEDLMFLAQAGHEVVGIEMVESAVQAFFAEHSLVPQVSVRAGGIREYAAAGIRILNGDLFCVDSDQVGEIDAIYDRAALIALPPEMRRRYAERVAMWAQPGAKLLLITLEYDLSLKQGPPFSVDGDEIRACYPHAAVDELWHQHTKLAGDVAATERGWVLSL